MADIFSKEKRSQIMAAVRSTETKPEVSLRKFLFAKGFRYRKNFKPLPGTPDIVLKKYNLIIFVHGCFWHGHVGCVNGNLPKSNIEYWKTKITTNTQRDIKKVNTLISLGWRVMTIWECEILEILKENSVAQKCFLDSIH